MHVADPDTFVNWLRIDEPGENPKWESKCGVITQMAFGQRLDEFNGQRWTNRTKTKLEQGVIYTTFAKAKRSIERQYFMMYPEESGPAY